MSLLEIPVRMRASHLQQWKGRFEVITPAGWKYVAIPVELGSLACSECSGCLAIELTLAARTFETPT